MMVSLIKRDVKRLDLWYAGVTHTEVRMTFKIRNKAMDEPRPFYFSSGLGKNRGMG
jgi:hypothetical protein